MPTEVDRSTIAGSAQTHLKDQPAALNANFVFYRPARDKGRMDYPPESDPLAAVSYTHLRAHET